VLDGLSDINWQALDSEELPDWLIALRSEDFNTRLQAGFKLSKYFCDNAHAFNVILEIEARLSNDAPVLATPFLLELLTVDDIDNKSILFNMLYTVSDYYRVERLTGYKRKRADAIHQIMLKHIPFFLELLHQETLSSRATLIYLLRHFEEEKDIIVDSLLQWMESTLSGDEESKIASVSVAYQFLSRADVTTTQAQRLINCLQIWIDSPLDTLSTKAEASYLLICLLGDDVQPETLKLFCNILKLPISSELYLPLWDDCVVALHNLSEPDRINVLLDIFDDQTDIHLIFHMVVSLLAIYFDTDRYTGIYLSQYFHHNPRVEIPSDISVAVPKITLPLTLHQQTVLQHIVDKDIVWTIQTNIFEVFGLPSTRESLSKLIKHAES